MPKAKFAGVAFQYPEVHGGRRVDVISTSGETMDEVKLWCLHRVAKMEPECAYEIHQYVDGGTVSDERWYSSLKAKAWHRTSATAAEQRTKHLWYILDASQGDAGPPPDATATADPDWMHEGSDHRPVAPAKQYDKGENMAYAVIVYGYPVSGETDPVYFRALPYCDVGTLADTITEWQRACGGTWVRETWALWEDNARMLETQASDPHWFEVHYNSKRAAEYREMIHFSTKLCMGMIPPPSMQRVSEVAHRKASEAAAEVGGDMGVTVDEWRQATAGKVGDVEGEAAAAEEAFRTGWEAGREETPGGTKTFDLDGNPMGNGTESQP